MKLTEAQKNDIIIMTSGHYLTTHLPRDFADMTDETFDEWVQDHAWEPFEFWDGNKIYAAISSAADATISYIENQLKEEK